MRSIALSMSTDRSDAVTRCPASPAAYRVNFQYFL